MKKEKENYNRQWRNVIQRIIRDYSEQLYAKNWTTGRNGQILRKVQPSNTEPERNRKYEQINHKH